LEIITDHSVDNSFAAFVKAQKRMVVVVIFSYAMESFCSVLLGIGLGIINLETIKPIGVLLIQCFFLGFVIIDNYNEIFHMSVKQSFRYTKHYAGVALAIGIPVYLVMLMPILGTIAGPVIGAIVATVSMNQLLLKDNNMQLVLEQK